MKGPTIKQLQEQLDTIRELREGDNNHRNQLLSEIEKLRGEIKARDAYQEQLRQEAQWLKRLVQNLSEAIIGRSR